MRYGLRHDGTPGSHGVRSTLCVSSQTGCGMACPFCATGQGGLQETQHRGDRRPSTCGRCDAGCRRAARRSGTAQQRGLHGHGRAAGQLQRGPAGGTSDHLARTRWPRHLGSGRHVSTSVSYRASSSWRTPGSPSHSRSRCSAPDDELRDTLVPINTRHKVDEVVDAAWRYAEKTKRRVSIEYALIKDINDQAWRADRLAKILQARGDWAGSTSTSSRSTRRQVPSGPRHAPRTRPEFVRRLADHGVPVTVRDTRGREIDGAAASWQPRARQVGPPASFRYAARPFHQTAGSDGRPAARRRSFHQSAGCGTLFRVE